MHRNYDAGSRGPQPYKRGLQRPDTHIHRRPQGFYEEETAWAVPSGLERKYEIMNAGPKPDFALTDVEEQLLEDEADLRVLSESGDVDAARELIVDMGERRVERRRQAWQSVLGACARAGRWQDAIEVLREMVVAGWKPDHDAYHASLEACERRRVPDQAIQLVEEMRDVGLNPNLVTYIKIITILAEEGRDQDAMMYYKEAQAVGALSPWTKRGNTLDVQHYTTTMAKVMVRSACRERSVLEWAGRQTFWIRTGQHDHMTDKLREVCKVLRNEFGFHITVAPARLGKVRVRTGQLKANAEEMVMRGEYHPGKPRNLAGFIDHDRQYEELMETRGQEAAETFETGRGGVTYY